MAKIGPWKVRIGFATLTHIIDISSLHYLFIDQNHASKWPDFVKKAFQGKFDVFPILIINNS